MTTDLNIKDEKYNEITFHWDPDYQTNTPLTITADNVEYYITLDQARHIRNYITAILNHHGHQ